MFDNIYKLIVHTYTIYFKVNCCDVKKKKGKKKRKGIVIGV